MREREREFAFAGKQRSLSVKRPLRVNNVVQMVQSKLDTSKNSKVQVSKKERTGPTTPF